MENKKGNIWGIIIIIGGLFILMFLGLLFAFGFGIMNWVGDETVPLLKSVGMVDNWNSTASIEYTIDPLNSILQQSTWLGGVFYALSLLMIFGVAFIYRNYNVRFMIPLFFGMMVILFIASIFVSNIYEEFQTSNDDLGTRLQEQSLLSFFLLYAPGIIALVGFLAGAIMFSGPGVEM